MATATGVDTHIVEQIMTKGIVRYFAIFRAKDTLGAIKDWFEGRISIDADSDALKNRKLNIGQ